MPKKGVTDIFAETETHIVAIKQIQMGSTHANIFPYSYEIFHAKLVAYASFKVKLTSKGKYLFSFFEQIILL